MTESVVKERILRGQLQKTDYIKRDDGPWRLVGNAMSVYFDQHTVAKLQNKADNAAEKTLEVAEQVVKQRRIVKRRGFFARLFRR